MMVILEEEGDYNFLFFKVGDRFMFILLWFLIHI